MTCRLGQKLIQLNRPGELTENEAQRLQAHLATCSTCQLEMEFVRRTPLGKSLLQIPVPNDTQVEGSVMEIMKTIGAFAETERRTSLSLRTLSHALLSHRFRFASTLAATLCMLTLLVQGAFLARDVFHIEGQVASATAHASPIALLLSSSSSTILRQKMGADDAVLQALEGSADPRLKNAAPSFLGLHTNPSIPAKD